MHHHDTMKTIAKTCSSDRECSAQDAVYFVNTNFPEEKVQMLLSEKELRELPLPEKCPNTEFFLIRIFLYLD